MSEFDLNYLPKLPRDKNVGIGCIGSGFIMADCHLVAYRQAGLNPIAITARNMDRARQVAARHAIPKVYEDYRELLVDPQIQIVDIAVPPDVQFEVIKEIAARRKHIRGILAQKPLGVDYAQAVESVRICEEAGIVLAVNQNMRYDQSVRAMKQLLDQKAIGESILATIEMRAIPHWMPWQERQGWVTLRIMSIHHLDTFRYWFGDPVRIFASTRTDPRTANRFSHEDGICLYILEYGNGFRASAWDDVWAGPAKEGAASDSYIRWRIEGTEGMVRGTIGWPEYPKASPSTLDYTTIATGPNWIQPRWKEAWFPDAFAGPMAQLLCALEDNTTPEISGRDNLRTMALVDAAYRSAREHRAVEIDEITGIYET
ncbi:MAG: Gfo/Idh/MocA family oxidoreductase [Pirellulaceae bacterium]|nr:Gfo/Idh/MocA family oxidoreductase [Pirellulaceae bacterium]